MSRALRLLQASVTVILLVATFIASRAVAYETFFKGNAWQDNPYGIKVWRPAYGAEFGLSADSTMSLVKNANAAWINLGIDLPQSIQFHDENYTGGFDYDYDAAFCCNGDCSSGCAGHTDRTIFSDDCTTTLYRNSFSTFYSMDRTHAIDYQALLTHETGHCHGLGDAPTTPGSPEAVMQQGFYFDGVIAKRFPRTDDRHGSMDTEGTANFPIYWRTGTGSFAWTSTGNSGSGPVGVAASLLPDGWSWSLLAWPGPNYPSYIHLRGRRVVDGANAPECTISSEYTYDGVSVARDGNGFAVAYRADNDSASILALRGIVPTTSSACGAGVGSSQLLPVASRRRPTLAWHHGLSRLLAITVDKDTGSLMLTSSTPGSSTWTTPTSVASEWTDTPVGFTCDQWLPVSGYMCWIALPSGDGSHAMRILEGTITVGTTVTFNEIGSWILPALSAGNVSPSIRVESGTNLRIFYGGMDDARSLNELVGTCTYTGCSWSNTVIPGRSPFGTGMDPNLEIHMGYP